MRINESELRKAGWRQSGTSWFPPEAPRRVVEAVEAERQRHSSEAKMHFYQTVLGLTESQAREAVELENQSLNDPAVRMIREIHKTK